MCRNLRGLIFLPTLIAACATVGCLNEYAVEQCIPGYGIVIDNKDAPRIGPTFAPVNLTLFGDFQCPGTHQLWYFLSEFLSKLEEDGFNVNVNTFSGSEGDEGGLVNGTNEETQRSVTVMVGSSAPTCTR